MEALTDIGIAVLNVRQPYCLSGEQVVAFAETVKPEVIIPIHWMPSDNTYRDAEQIETIQNNLPGSTELVILVLE